ARGAGGAGGAGGLAQRQVAQYGGLGGTGGAGGLRLNRVGDQNDGKERGCRPLPNRNGYSHGCLLTSWCRDELTDMNSIVIIEQSAKTDSVQMT
ncbi:MAG TPA: hypothetical protein VJ728_02270, partial [Candidatus Binataceae bacterium]|nr:hypothetical protein [Candidatus Binataceae bacterium]